LDLFDKAYTVDNQDSIFENTKELSLGTQKFLDISKKAFESWNKYLEEHNAVDRVYYITHRIKDITQIGEINKTKTEHIKSIEFHSSINEIFPDFCKLLTECNI
jgi:hypothetical protein